MKKFLKNIILIFLLLVAVFWVFAYTSYKLISFPGMKPENALIFSFLVAIFFLLFLVIIKVCYDKTKNIKIFLILFLALIVSMITMYKGTVYYQDYLIKQQPSIPREFGTDPEDFSCGGPCPPGVTLRIISPADISQDDILMGASHNVFVGRVIKQSGEKALGASPETQFQVEIIENIKGDLNGMVTVNQLGGYQNGVLVTVEQESNGTTEQSNKGTNEPYLLQIGATYLFATRYNEGEDWYTLISFPTGRKLLSKDGNASVAELKSIAQNDERVQALTAAYPNEKLPDADIQHHNTRNNYKDREAEMEAKRTAPTQ